MRTHWSCFPVHGFDELLAGARFRSNHSLSHANVMFAMGGGIRGGKVYGEWPGLQDEQLYENRDLALTTDFRDVLGELVAKHLGNANLKTVFPGYENPKFRGLIG